MNGLAYLRVAEKVLAELGCEHTLHCCLDLFQALVDNAIGAYVYVLTLCRVKRGLIGTNVEADDNCVGCCSKGNVTLGDTACRCVNNANLNFLVGKLEKRCLNRLNRAVYVCLNNDVQILNTLGDLCKQIVEVCTCVCFESIFLSLVATLICQCSCHSFIFNCLEFVTCRGNLGKTGDLYGNRGSSCLERSAQVVGHRTNVTNCGTCNNNITTVECTVLNENGCNRSASAVELRFDNDTLCTAIRICFEFLNVCYEQYALKQIIDTLSCESRYGNADGISAPFLGNKTVLGELLLNLIGVSGGFIHLVDGDNDVDFSSLCVVDCLNGLGHNTVVCRYYENCNIGCHSTTCTHCGKCGVSGSIQEGDITSACLYAVSTDVLSNTACFACCYVGVTDSIENRGLTVVNVTHNAYNGCALLELLIGIRCVVKQTLFNADDYLGGSFNAELIGYECGGIKVDNLVDGCHHPHHNQLLNNLTCCYVQLGSELSYNDLFGNFNRGGLVINRLLNSGSRSFASLVLFVVFVALAKCVLTLLCGIVLLFELLVATGKVLIAIGYEVIQTLIVLGKVNSRGMGIDYARTLACSIGIDVGGSTTHDRLCLEGILGCALYKITLVTVKAVATASTAVIVLVKVAAILLCAKVVAALCRTTTKGFGALCTAKCGLTTLRCSLLRSCRTSRGLCGHLLYVNTGGAVLLRAERIAGVGLASRGTCCGCGLLCGSRSHRCLGRGLFCLVFFCLFLCYVLRTCSGGFFFCTRRRCSFGFGSSFFLFCRLFGLCGLLSLFGLCGFFSFFRCLCYLSLFCHLDLFNLFCFFSFFGLFNFFGFFNLLYFRGNMGHSIQVTTDIVDLICLC